MRRSWWRGGMADIRRRVRIRNPRRMTTPPPNSSRFTRRRFLGLSAGAAASLALASCGDDDTEPSAQPETGSTDDGTDTGTDAGAVEGKLRVAAFANNHAAAPLFWPMFAPEGIEVEVTTLSSGTDMNTALQNGELDFAVFGIVNGFVEAEGGFDTRIVSMGARQGAGLIVRRDDPATSVADLAGRRIGFKGPAFQYLALLALLEDAGLDPEADVDLIPVEWNDMPTALASGDVDAFMGTEPNPSRSVASGVGRRLVNPYTTAIGQLNSALWASPKVLEDVDLTKEAVKMHRAACEHLSPGGTNDPDVWRDLVVDQYGFEVPVYEELLTNVGAVWELNDFWIDQAKANGDKMVELGILDDRPDYDTIIDTSFQP